MNIYHITRQTDWERALEMGGYRADTLETQGFIHCSTKEQIIQTANTFYHGQPGLVLLSIKSEKVIPEIRYENLEGGQKLFPHIYGPLNLDAIITLDQFEPRQDGTFILPGDIINN
ncbi:MAG: DUF952 domain-containing protein [Anaerolineaceae bacterium]|nr:DUF952 domain-containing protein [Anaerolineaceae bacterium]